MTHDPITLWSQHPYFDPATRAELTALAGNPKELDDRFYKSLEFGTGGLRGLIGAGTNRMNRYTIRQATWGLAEYIASFGPDAMARGVVIAHDSRRFSPEFALETALTLNARGIVAYLWDSLRPTPMLSYAVRELKAIAGVVITASHNPKEYNGYKVYWEDGGQVPPERASAIQAQIRAIADLTTIHPMDEEEAGQRNLLRTVPVQVDESYLTRLTSLTRSAPADRAACRILYTPLHGAGNIPVRQALERAGFQVSVVKEQEQPNGEFPTVRYPNPEERDVFALALQQAEVEQPDLIMATDPDSDRLGVLLREPTGSYRLLNGNELGAALVSYLIDSQMATGQLPMNGAVIKTIATSNLLAGFCADNGVALIDTHTGFKFIGDKIREFEETGSHTFLFGYEESYGYLGATFVRDKDAVMAALLTADAVAYYRGVGLTLLRVLQRLWQRYGHFVEDLHNVTLPGKEGQEQIAALMQRLRTEPPTQFAGLPIATTDDYATGTRFDHATGQTSPLALARANVLHYRFADGGFVMVRPSGTEPKLKLYFSVVGSSRADAEERLAAIRSATLQLMGLTT